MTRHFGPLLVTLAAACGGSSSLVAPTTLSEAQKSRDAALVPQLTPLLAAYENFGAKLSPDGKQLLFRSNRGGVTGLYLAEVAHPDLAPRKLVAGPERIASAAFTRDGTAALFREDTGANEDFHLFRVGLDGSGLTDLSVTEAGKDPLWRDPPLLPVGKPGLMVYSSRRTRAPSTMIFVQDLNGGAPRLAYTDPSPGVAVDVSPDGARALLVLHGIGVQTLVEVDLSAGKTRRLYPAEGVHATVATAAYSADGARVLVATDGGGESYSLLALDRRSSAKLAEYRQESPAFAAIGSIVPSPRGDRVAILIDAGNHALVRLLDANTLALTAEVATPLGTPSLGTTTEVRVPIHDGQTFTADGQHFVISLSLPQTPEDLYLVDSSSGAIEPLRHDLRDGLGQLPAMTSAIENVAAFDGLTIPVNVYLPSPARNAGAGRLPTIVSFHGGPDASSSLDWSPWTRAFVAAGFAVLEPNVRGSTGFGRAYEKADDREKRWDAIKDMASVNRWARAQSWCDPNRLVVMGASFGGYMVLMALTQQPALWQAGVDLAGISDLTSMSKYAAQSGQVHAANEIGEGAKDAKILAELSPLRQADKIVAPLFVYHGQNDTHVPRAQADAIVRTLRRRHIVVEYMLALNEGHTVARRENEIEFLTRMLRFLHDELKLPDR